MFNRRNLIFALLALMVLTLAACGGPESTTVELPSFVQNASHTVQTAYRFAIEHPDMLEHQPCYCGCGPMGHNSNLGCYIRNIDESGRITFDTHALGCGICIDITLDVMRLSAEGKSNLEIRRYVDAKYSPFGPSTDTPLPEA
jgi:hypothetical protein